MNGIKGIGHVAIKVKDIDRSLDFYERLMGFAEMLRLHHEDGSLWLVYLRITDTQYLEIFPDAEDDHAPGPNANGINHLCLETDDLDAVIKAVGEAGIPLTSPTKTGADGNRQAWIADPDGNRIELMEMAANSLQVKAIKRLRGQPASA